MDEASDGVERFGGVLARRSSGVPVAELAGLEVARALSGGGWRSVRHFLLADAREVALRSGLPEPRVRHLQEAGGLRRVAGLGPRGVEALVAVGVLTRGLLAQADPVELHLRLRDRFGAAAPPPRTVQRWVGAARAQAPPRER